jgi:hypothetical protein
LRMEITSEEWGQIWITEIKWIENFDIISKVQSQSSSSNVVIINWKTETKTESKVNIDFTLKAKIKWDYEVWPAILSDWKNEIKTNTVKITVRWDNLFVNNRKPNINTQNNWNTQSNWNTQNNIKKEDNSIVDYENIDKRNFSSDKSLYILIWLIIFISFITYIIIKKNPKLLEKIINKDNDKEIVEKEENKDEYVEEIFEKSLDKFTKQVEEEDLVNLEKLEILEKDLEKDLEIKSENKEKSTEKNNQTEIKNTKLKYPDLSDKEFITKINEIFKHKIWKKYNIKNTDNKTYQEILDFVDSEKKDSIQSIVDLLNKAKYSNKHLDNEKILELVKNIKF